MTQNHSAGKPQGRTRVKRYPQAQQAARTVRPAALPMARDIHYQHTSVIPHKTSRTISPGVLGLVAAVGVGAVAVGIVGSCSGSANAALPCPVPTTGASGTPTPRSTPIICTTSGGTHYIWVSSNGGWVRSDDGEHPNPGARGVGEGDGGDGHGGVGDGHGGSGHAGGDGG